MTVPASRVRELVDRYKTAFAAHHAGVVAALHAPDGTFHLHTGEGVVHGRERIADRFEAFFDLWPTLEVVPRHEFVGDGFWVLDWTLLVPTGRGLRRTLDCLDVVVLDDDGLVRTKDTWIDPEQFTVLRREIGAAS